MVGTTVSHYRILAKVGEGGMGVVYRAHDTTLDRDVALKFLAHSLKVSETDQVRFLQEARSAALLNHPHICTIYDVLELDEESLGGKQSVIVMEYVDGKSLREMLPVSTIKQAMELGVQIAAGLAAAHEKGLIHRDVKPENIMVFKGGGRAVIMDFGLAKLKGSLSLTRTGTTVGTVKYMSPEQVCGGEVDHRSDIFSLGVVLYELFTGHSPFKGEHEAAVLYEIANAEPPLPSHYKPDIPREIEALILECLAKDANERIQSAAEVRRRLSAVSSSSRKAAGTIESRPVKSSPAEERSAPPNSKPLSIRWKRLPWALGGFFALAFGALGTLYLLRAPAVMDLSALVFTPVANSPEVEEAGVFSPDGKSVAYLRTVDNHNQLFVKNVDPNALAMQLTTGSTVDAPFWSPNGDVIYFLRDDQLWSIGTAGGEPRRLFDAGYFCQAATLSRDGKTLLIWGETVRDSSLRNPSQAHPYSLLVSSPPGAPPHPLTPSPYELPYPLRPVFVRISPDGSTAALSRYRPEGGSAFWIIPLTGNGVPHEVLWERDIAFPVAFDWFPDSRTIVLGDGDLWYGDTRTGRMRRMSAGPQSLGYPNVYSDGRKVLFSDGTGDLDIAQVPVDGTPPRTLIGSKFNEFNPSWSSSGERMAYLTDRSGRRAIWIRNSREDLRAVVTVDQFTNQLSAGLSNPVISPDGKRIAYTVWGKNMRRRLYASPAEGGRPTRLLDEDVRWLPSWSPDSKHLVAMVVRSGPSYPLVILSIGTQDSARTILEDRRIWSPPVWSPVGNWIACGISADSILLLAPDGRQTRMLKSPVRISRGAADYSLTWSKDGSLLYVLSSSGDESRLDELNIHTGRSRKLAGYGWSVVYGGTTLGVFLTTLSPDGKSLTTTIQKASGDIWMLEGFPDPATLW